MPLNTQFARAWQNNHELVALLPTVHQDPKQAVTVEMQKKIMLNGHRNKRGGSGSGRSVPDSAFSVSIMALWKPEVNRVASVTNSSVHAFSLGCMAGHFITAAQKMCLINFVAANPTWTPTSIAGRFFLDHLIVGKNATAMRKGEYPEYHNNCHRA